MKKEIRHRRLYAFYHSKALNALMIVIIIGLLLADYNDFSIIAIISSTTALLLFLGYSAWLWIKKPHQIIINRWLSDISGWFILYFLCMLAIKASNEWLYILPCVGAVVLMFLSMVIPGKDEAFIISEASPEAVEQT